MSYRPHGQARVNPNNPRAFARCDRCGRIFNHSDLRFQFDYRGPRLANLRILVCQPCYDKPQAQLKPVLLTADPTPILNARPENYIYANTNTRATSGQNLTPNAGSGNGSTVTLTFNIDSSVTPPAAGTTIVVQGMVPETYNGTYLVSASTSTPAWTISYANSTTAGLTYFGQVLTAIDPQTGLQIRSSDTRVTQGGDTRSTQVIGIPTGLNADAVPPLYLKAQYHRLLAATSMTANGTDVISVTTSTAHGLSTNGQIAVEGAATTLVDGFYSVTVISATAFTYQANTAIPAGSVLGSNTQINTVLVGLPTSFDQIPQTGI